MISSVLIANRGEIATRISRTCRKMGIRSIAVFSDADRHMPFVEAADEAIYIGASSPTESYLDQDKIIRAAEMTGAEAIHPGYGFLSENATFAQRCADVGILFIGPNPTAIASMGSKSRAKSIMMEHHVPTLPGYQGEDQSQERFMKESAQIGYPVLLKATAGGGGKGMRIVWDEDELPSAIDAARREAQSAFGDDELIIEKYLQSARHIEFQIFGDQHGHFIHLLERECTIQRRYQKVVEESPSPMMSPQLRKQMGTAAVRAAKAISYDNAGTVEFIYDQTSGDYYFLEVNTRLQVEHPVTELITGLDLVQMQIESAQGLPLRITQEEVQADGYAIEIRLYAEDPYHDFRPVTGRVEHLDIPQLEGLRVESAIRSGSEISIYYDPMIAKLIVHDIDRATAHRKLSYVLSNMVCSGTVTNQSLLSEILAHKEFRRGQYDTHFIDKHIDLSEVQIAEKELFDALIASTLYRWNKRNSKRVLLRAMPSGWRNSFNDYQKDSFRYGDQVLDVSYRYLRGMFDIMISSGDHINAQIASVEKQEITIEIDGYIKTYCIIETPESIYAHHPNVGNIILEKIDRLPVKESEKIAGDYAAPMPAQVIKVLIKEGQSVACGDPLVIISSMKMESTVEAESAGIVEEVYVAESQTIEAGHIMLKMK